MKMCLYFHVHQPYRVKKFNFFDIGKDKDYFKTEDIKQCNKTIFKKVASKCYLPANKVFLDILKKHKDFKMAFSITGVFLEQAEQFDKKVLTSFKKLIDTGRVEILAETYHHSLAFLYSKDEFLSQVKLHDDKIYKLFGVKPKVFRNTELIYNNDLAQFVKNMGYKGILSEGVDRILGWRSPNFLYKAKGSNLPLLLKNYKLSDDIAWRFGEKGWKDHPLSSSKFIKWVNEHEGNGEVVNLFMDYETFGEHQWEDTGIFEFLKHIPEEFLKDKNNSFVTPSEAIDNLNIHDTLDIKEYITWADENRDLTAWLGNSMQTQASDRIYKLEESIKQINSPATVKDWRRLTTSDHVYYMCTKWFNDGDVHKYFSPYESPYEAFISFMNAVSDLEMRVEKKMLVKK